MFEEIGRIGVWRAATQLSPELAVTLERLGYEAMWIGGSPSGDLRLALTHMPFPEQELAVEVALLDRVHVSDPDLAVWPGS